MTPARLTGFAACVALWLAPPALAQNAEVQDLGHGIYRAAGLMGSRIRDAEARLK